MISEAESPTLAEIPISTLSIGQSTEIQTEQPADLAPNTTFVCSVKEPDKVVTQTLWGTSEPEASLLLAAGKSLLRLNLVPKNTGTNSTPPPHSMDLKIPLENRFNITAVCWNSDGEVTVSAQEEKTNERGETMKTDKLFRLIEGGSEFRVVSSTAGFVTTLRWNESKQLLLAISSDGIRGSIKVWKLDSEDDGDVQAAALTEFTETTIFDAVWTGDSTFAVGGMGIFHIYDVGEAISLKHKFDTQITWENLKYDTSSGIIAATGIEGQTNHLAILHPSDPTNLQTHEYPDDYLADLDFRPQTKANGLGLSSLTYPPASSPVLLATCAASGVVRVWDATQPFKCLEHLPIADGGTFASNNIAFSPDGSLLAAAGPDAVTVWDLERREVPLATWKSDDFSNDEWNSSVDGEFSLGWDPNSSRLSIALGNQVRIGRNIRENPC
jgi:WD40 repeat protein